MLIGRLTQDIELKTFWDNKKVVNFSLATNRNWTDANGVKQDEAEFHNIVIYWKLAELAEQFLWKWKLVYIEWRSKTRNWTAEDGTKRYKTEIIADTFNLLERKPQTTNLEDNEDIKEDKTKWKSKKTDEVSIEDIPF